MEEKYIEIITETSERAKSNTHQIDEIKEQIKGIKEDNFQFVNLLCFLLHRKLVVLDYLLIFQCISQYLVT